MLVDINCTPNMLVTSESYSSELSIKDCNVFTICITNSTSGVIVSDFYIVVTNFVSFNYFWYILVPYTKTTIFGKFKVVKANSVVVTAEIALLIIFLTIFFSLLSFVFWIGFLENGGGLVLIGNTPFLIACFSILVLLS